MVYGSNSLEERKELWDGLLRLGATITTPWCICGDFKSPLSSEDRTGGNPVGDAETRDFQNVVNTLVLVDMKATGRILTWTSGHVWSKIDRALCNAEWVAQYGAITAQFQENHFSDHSPIHIDISRASNLNRKPFRFLNILAEEEQFLHIVEYTWQQQVQGTAMYRLWCKLNYCKEPLKKLKTGRLGSIDGRIEEFREKLETIQTHITTSPTPELMAQEKIAMGEFTKWMNIQEKVLRQKSEAHWIKEGDGNNMYFFNCMKDRASSNSISLLKDST
ncbi:uncharacterized protein LOC132641863 [Lycium barbarum]|uniref:uncharacterized protein LOC132641863 n=1 Tax=Lycium barbarum TaxID=112863 RepID=UPI00293F74BC|nr:uncharacterized protein LOC132641863 [Lycium barbarum]